MVVIVGALSLITPDPEEQKIEVFSNVTFPGYNRDTKLHDIALIEVNMLRGLFRFFRNEIKVKYVCFFLSYPVPLFSALPPLQFVTTKLTNLPNRGLEPLSDGAQLP